MTTTSLVPALQELQARPQWVCWRKEQRRGTFTKIPYTPSTGLPARSNDPATWTSYATACSALQQSPDRFDGLGYMFDRDLTGVDLDHCIHEDGTIEDWAQSILDRLQSYSEYSPGGAGIHILVRGTIPRGLRRTVPHASHPEAAIEMYCEGRYFTITGKHVAGTPSTIEARQEALLALHAQISAPSPQHAGHLSSSPASVDLSNTNLLDKARSAKDGAKFWALWNGETSGYLSPSEAELALCTLLAFWTGKDIKRMDRLFRRSGLYREKWDERHGRDTYGTLTLARAIEGCTQVYAPAQRHTQTHTSGNDGAGRVPSAPAAPGSPDDFPDIFLGGQLREMTDAAVEAMMRLELRVPTLFMQSARLVRVGRTETQRPIVTQMGIAEVKEVLTHSANFYRLKKVPGTEGDYAKIPVSPPKEVAEQILARQTQQPYLPFPPLEAIVETPVLRPDGSILDTPGYDAATCLYYAPHTGMDACKVPATPTAAERDAALALIQETIGEFPYVEEADRANALALLLTPLLRPAIKGHIPLGLIDAPKQGTGKGLYADVVSIIATGESVPILTVPETEEEWDKKITSLLIEGTTIIVIDNISGRLQSSKLDAVLTAHQHRGRILGQSKMVIVPNRATWLATGNNIKLGGDLARRCYRIRLDPHVSRPWMRTGFRHEDLAGWVREHRAELIGALLTLARAWYVAGRPNASGIPSLATFTTWAKTVGSILAHAGVKGFLANLEQLYEEADEEGSQWEAFLHAWLHTLGTQWVTTSQVIDHIHDAGSVAGSCETLPANALEEMLPEALQLALKEKPSSFAIKLGKALEKRVDACFGEENVRIERGNESHSKQKRWRVVAGSAGSVAIPSPVKKSGENNSNKDETYYPHYPHDHHGKMRQHGSTRETRSLSPHGDNEPFAGSVHELPAVDADEREVFEL